MIKSVRFLPALSLPVFFLVTVLSSCAVEVRTVFDPRTDFRKYKTYCWMEGCGSVKHTGVASRDTAMERQLRTELTFELQKKGLRLTQQDPDVLFALRVVTSDEQTVLYRRPNEAPMGWSPEARVDILSFTKGTIVVAMADHRSGNLVWESNAVDYVADRTEITGKNIRRVVRSILADFPPDTETMRKRTTGVY